ncbi:MAG: hypothetical protein ACT4P1_13025 [Sporichthyaceae bacterium]
MRTLTMRRPVHLTPVPGGWPGPSVIAVTGASGGAGASTLCALLAGALADQVNMTERRTAVLDSAQGSSPWPDWLNPGSDPALGDEGLQIAELCGPPRAPFPRSLVLRCASAIRGLDGVAVLTYTAPGDSPPGPERVMGSFAVTVQDLPPLPSEELAARFRDAPGGLLLAVAGTADGVAGGLRATRAWALAGLPPSRIRPVVVAGAAGGLSPRARSRLALLDANTLPVSIVPFDPAISRRGLSEALASGAIGAPTRIAVRRVLASLTAPQTAEVPAPRRGDLALFELPDQHADSPVRPSVPATERTAR